MNKNAQQYQSGKNLILHLEDPIYTFQSKNFMRTAFPDLPNNHCFSAGLDQLESIER